MFGSVLAATLSNLMSATIAGMFLTLNGWRIVA
jgi:hypothetical protein